MRLLVLSAVAFLVFAACSAEGGSGATAPSQTGGSDGSSTPAATRVVPTPLPRAASNCSGVLPAGVEPGRSNLQQLNVGIDVRTYRVFLPPGFDNTSASPVVLNFHGLGGLAEGQEALSGFMPLAADEGFLLVTPQGLGDPPSWNFGVGSGIFPGGPDDVGFVATLLDALASELCVDQSRVYAIGFSNGAFFASALACRLPDRIAAVVPVAGVDYPLAGCPAFVPVLAFHGTGDVVVPFENGSIFGLLAYEGAREHVASWAELGGCAPDAAPEPLGDGSTLEGYDCPGGVTSGLVVLEGAGHLWPLDLAPRMWEFLDENALPVR